MKGKYFLDQLRPFESFRSSWEENSSHRPLGQPLPNHAVSSSHSRFDIWDRYGEKTNWQGFYRFEACCCFSIVLEIWIDKQIQTQLVVLVQRSKTKKKKARDATKGHMMAMKIVCVRVVLS